MGAQRRSEEDSSSGINLPVAAEVLRLANCPPKEPAGKDEEKISVFWRVFGGTLLSIVALVVVTAYQGMSNSISDLRSALTRVQESQADFVKKEDVYGRCTSLWTSLTALSGQVPEIKSRSAQIEEGLKEQERDQKELRDRLQQLSERLAKLEARRSAPLAQKATPPGMVPAE